MRLLLINNAGDVKEAYERLHGGGPETYHAQRYTVEGYAKLQEIAASVSVMVMWTDRAYSEMLDNGLRVVGAGVRGSPPVWVWDRLVRREDPTHVIASFLDSSLLAVLALRGITFVPALSSSLGTPRNRLRSKVRATVRRAGFAGLLNRANVPWIGSYGLNSSRILRSIGVRADKIVPWDFLLDEDAGPFEPKEAPTGRRCRVCYIGSLVEAKGVSDLVSALGQLVSEGMDVEATLVGMDTDRYVEGLRREFGLEDRIRLPGMVAATEVEAVMNAHDVVVVPSRHEYPEGFPLVLHHALRSRTPIVCSDHPMFGGILKDRESAFVFEGGSPTALATALRTALSETESYEAVSRASHDAWRDLRLEVKWFDFLTRSLSTAPEDVEWLRERSLRAMEPSR